MAKKKYKKSKSLGSTPKQDKLGIIGAIGSFVFPVVGAVIYFRNIDDQPKRAKAAGGLALAGMASWAIGTAINSMNKPKTTETTESAKIMEKPTFKPLFQN